MASEAAIEAVPAEQLKNDVTRLVAEHLATLKAATRSRTTKGSSRDAHVVVDGQLFEFKRRMISGAQLREAVRSALGEIVGRNTQVFLLHNIDAQLAPIIAAMLKQAPEAVRARRQALTAQHIDALVDVYLPNDLLAAAMPDLERDNAEAQAGFLKKWPMRTAEELAEFAGHGSNNRSATATRWKKAGKIFGVPKGRREFYPAFQFNEGRPRPVIGKVLQALPAEMSPWQTAFWFIGPNSWLGDKSPVERLDDEAAVIGAASNEGQAWMG